MNARAIGQLAELPLPVGLARVRAMSPDEVLNCLRIVSPPSNAARGRTLVLALEAARLKGDVPTRDRVLGSVVAALQDPSPYFPAEPDRASARSHLHDEFVRVVAAPDRGGILAVHLGLAIGRLAWDAGDLAAGIRVMTETLALADRAGHEGLLSWSLMRLGLMLAENRQVTDGVAYLMEGKIRAQRAPLAHQPGQAQIFAKIIDDVNHAAGVRSSRSKGFDLLYVHTTNPEAREVNRLVQAMTTFAIDSVQGDDAASDALVWLVDRMMLFEPTRLRLKASQPLAQALPNLARLHAAEDERLKAEQAHDWTRMVNLTEASQRHAREMGLACLSHYLDAVAAEALLNAGRLQAALDCARNARALGRAATTPLDISLRRALERLPASLAAPLTIPLEYETMHVWAMTGDAQEHARVIVARVFIHALGPDHGLQGAEGIDSIVALSMSAEPNQAAALARLLRDAGRSRDALAALERALPLANEDGVRGEILLTRASIRINDALVADAYEDLRSAESLLVGPASWLPRANAAALFTACGAHADSIELLDAIEVDLVARSDIDRITLLTLRALALRGLGRTAEAVAASERAVAIAETMRGTLRTVALRTSFAERHEDTYDTAVQCAASVGDARRALELVEVARSRRLVDEMAQGHPPPDAVGRRLDERRRRLAEARDILQSLQSRSLEEQIVLRKRLAELDVMFAGKEASDVLPLVARLEAILDEETDEWRVTTAEKLFGAVLGYDSMRLLLSANRLSA